MKGCQTPFLLGVRHHFAANKKREPRLPFFFPAPVVSLRLQLRVPRHFRPDGRFLLQVLAQGFQTYGEDFEIDKPKMDFTIKLKRPQGQYSVYDDHAKDGAPKSDVPPSKSDAPPSAPDKKPN